MNEIAINYFKSVNSISNRIISDLEYLKLQSENVEIENGRIFYDNNLIAYESKANDNPETLSEMDNGHDHWQPLITSNSARSTMTEVYDGHSGPFSWRSKSQEDLRIFESSPGSELMQINKRHNYASRMVIRPNPFVVGSDIQLDSGCPSSQESKQSSYDDLQSACNLKIAISQSKLQKSLLQGLNSCLEETNVSVDRIVSVDTNVSVDRNVLKRGLEHVNVAFVDSLENLQMNTPRSADNRRDDVDESVSDQYSGSPCTQRINRHDPVQSRGPLDDDYPHVMEVSDEARCLVNAEDEQLLSPSSTTEIPTSGFDFLDNW